jgi:hypothetical protein
MPNIFNRTSSALISLMISLVIIGLILWMMTMTHQRNEEPGTMMKDAGIDTTSYKTVLDSARKVTKDASHK